MSELESISETKANIQIINSLSIDKLKQLQNITEQNIVIKFTASWCAPCNKTREYVHNKFNELKNCLIVELDIDFDSEIYNFLKTKRMLIGIPTIMLWKNVERDYWYIPEETVSGTKIAEIDAFFNKCNK